MAAAFAQLRALDSETPSPTFLSAWVLLSELVRTVLRIDGLRVVIYPNDHPPAHVHVIGPGWVVVVDLLGPEVRQALGCNEPEAKRAIHLIIDHHAALLDFWRRYHG